MGICLPVQLNSPCRLNKNLNLPTGTISDFPIPWLLVALKIVLMIAAFSNMKLETYPRESGSLFGVVILQSYATVVDILCFFLPLAQGPSRNEMSYSGATKIIIIGFIIRCCLLLGGLAVSAAADNTSTIYLAATLGYIVVELIIWRQHRKHCIPQFKLLEDDLIEILKREYGRGHQLAEKVNCDFSILSANQQEMFWNDTPAEERDQSVFPEKLFCQRKDGREEYFVDWIAYSDVNSRIKANFTKIEMLIERNAELRNDLMRENQVISQMKRKIYGPDVDCSTHNQLPNSPAAVQPWNPALAEGLFNVYNLTTQLFVKLNDYREMADHYIHLNTSIFLLGEEKRHLVDALQRRKTIHNELVMKWLNGEDREEEEIQSKRLDDVD